MFSKRKKRSEFSEIDRASKDILAQINELEELVGKGTSIKAMQAERNTLPPPDQVMESIQKRTLNVAVASDNVRNCRREMKDNSFLLILLVISIAASAFWIVSLLDQS